MGRPFSSAAYETFMFPVPHEVFYRAKDAAMQQLGKPYDRASASWRILIRPPSPTTKAWWCASLSHYILKQIGVAKYQPLNTLGVSALVFVASKTIKKDNLAVRPIVDRQLVQGLQHALFASAVPYDQRFAMVRSAVQLATRNAVETSCQVTVPPHQTPVTHL